MFGLFCFAPARFSKSSTIRATLNFIYFSRPNLIHTHFSVHVDFLSIKDASLKSSTEYKLIAPEKMQLRMSRLEPQFFISTASVPITHSNCDGCISGRTVSH